MANGLSRRDMIKGAAVAGAAAWTAPVIIDSLTSAAGAQTTQTVCTLQKIPSCSSVNGGNVPSCTGADTANADFSACIVPQCDTYSPSTGFLFKVCGPVATNGIAQVKWGGNAKTCSPTSLNAEGCLEANFSGGAGNSTFFSGCTSPSSRASGYVMEWSAVGGNFSGNGGAITRSGTPGARWLLIWPPGTVNLIALGVCFTFGSVPPSCAAGSCA